MQNTTQATVIEQADDSQTAHTFRTVDVLLRRAKLEGDFIKVRILADARIQMALCAINGETDNSSKETARILSDTRFSITNTPSSKLYPWSKHHATRY